MPSPSEILSDPQWLAHRYDEARDGFRFIQLTREAHRGATFITDDYVEGSERFEFVSRSDVEQASVPEAPTDYVFHSAYCCSTMVARAFDIEGAAMGLKEPQLLNDILGWRRRGATPDQLRPVLATSLALLARPFRAGEKVVIKPSNIVSPLAEAILEARPEAKALFLYAPIESYLQSITKKGLWGRRWVREVLIGTIDDGYLVGGFEDQNLLGLTDLQVAALGWLSQHALFSRLIDRFGGDRIRALDSATLLDDQAASMKALFEHFGLDLGTEQFDEVMGGPAFTTHSKDASTRFDAKDRAVEQAEEAAVHGEEIGMVAQWAEAVAQSQGLHLELKSGLIR